MRGTYVEGAPSRPDADDLPRLEAETGLEAGTEVDSQAVGNWGGTAGIPAGPRRRIVGPTVDFFPPGKGAPVSRFGRAWLLVAAVVAVVVVAFVGAWTLVGRSPAAPPAPSPAIAVMSSARSAVGAKTADLSLAMTLNIPGSGRVTATGTGAIDLTDSASRISVAFDGTGGLRGHSLRMVFLGDTLYLSFQQGPAPQTSKPWVSESLAEARPLLPGNSDPVAVLGMLGSKGNHVVALGAGTVDGTAVHVYRVTITPAALRAELPHADIPPGLARTVEQALGTSSTVVTASVADSNGSLRRLAVDFPLAVGNNTVTASFTEGFSDYGAPVSITAPPASEVAPLGQPPAAAPSNPAPVST